ncbi:MAG: VCBS repeat-containing protein [Planctomycetes bacterium]|nr:VCBS repeat-containing protein [Planctomycetota bacterium]MCB9902815.1 VCBS repeat-containing protein [Planctomycetota bacterium]
MKILTISTLTLIAAPAFGRSDVLYHIDRPAGVLSGWGHSLVMLDDVDDDGVDDLAVGIFVHGGGNVATVHSGATGAHLYTLVAPVEPLFYGAGITSVRDENGDGVSDVVVVGSHSGDPNSPDGSIIVYSGADGAQLRLVRPTAGLFFQSHAQENQPAVADLDGDGHDEVFVRTTGGLGGYQLSLMSTTTGQALFTVTPAGLGNFTGPLLARLDDHDGDGVDDLAVPVRNGFDARVEIRSGATGAWITDIEPRGAHHLTGNGEPFFAVDDVDGDGMRDIALGAVFDGFVGVYSSADGSKLERWDCSAQPIACFGSRLIEIDDISGDGHSDLIAMESNAFGSGGVRLFGLDPMTGKLLFEEHNAALAGGYSNADRIIDAPGLDPQGFPSFALFEDLTGRVAVRRILPEVGARTCPSNPNSSGEAAVLHALGSASVSTDELSFELEHAPALQPAFFAFGSQLTSQPFGGGTLCIGGIVGRFPAVHMDASGGAALSVDLASFNGEIGSTWTFQAVFRDPAGDGFSTSDALRIELLP